ncbi:hypothetical protein BKA70DRAFT_346146 [Coprinopsis sp. MPI-PUGE-AT-0042]|nr:hypothetical protein BKA70DRAFT_346146 [Coprinopsis sp. MPI-PUGE-AT-0042]
MLEPSPFYSREDYNFRSTSSSSNLIFRTRRTRTRFAYDPSSVTGLSMLTLASAAVGHLLHASELDVVAVRRSLVHHHRQHHHHDHCQHHHGTEGSHPLGLGWGSEPSRFPRRGSRRSGDERSDRHMERFRSRRASARSIRVTWALGRRKFPPSVVPLFCIDCESGASGFRAISLSVFKRSHPEVFSTPTAGRECGPTHCERQRSSHLLHSLERPPQIDVSRRLACPGECGIAYD